MRLQATAVGGATQQVIPAFCFSTDAVGDVVYIMGNKVGSHYQVSRVDIDDITHMPAIGVLIKKDDASTCYVQTGGIVRDLYTGLTPNKPLFVGTNGRLTETVPGHKPSSGRRAIQVIAQALSSSELLLTVKSPILLVT